MLQSFQPHYYSNKGSFDKCERPVFNPSMKVKVAALRAAFMMIVRGVAVLVHVRA